VARIKNPKAYEKELVDLPDWRVGCVFTGGRHRRHGVARAALAAVLSAISEAGGGVVGAYPEQLDGRGPQRGAYLHTGPESLFEEFGFVRDRDRRIAKWRWVVRLTVPQDNRRLSPGMLNLGRSPARSDSSKPRREVAAFDPISRPGGRRRGTSLVEVTS